MRLQNKKAVVTGADSGIGRAITETFAREGADVVVHYRSDKDGAETTLRAVRDTGRRGEIVQADLGDTSAVTAFYDEACKAFGKPDIWINCAGMGSSASSSLEIDPDAFQKVIQVDLVAPWLLCQAAARDMCAGSGGAIVNVTSVHEEIVAPGSAPYDAAKAGLRSVTRTLALELAGKGVRINNVAPGMIATEMTADRLDDPKKNEQARSQIPMHRPGEPQEVANVVLFLASDEASYVTGSSYFVDGGLMVHIGGA
ncbi:SDR family NAD(P)-dependent oxidoreductase [Luteibacter sp. NPDC031894]|uniref:SDR family NAD(P)-dependent oxidoreductase n=1 Tax=Luteibacter sp. NPDC031894 TaxID=3390572 RepID=UPI003D0785E5